MLCEEHSHRCLEWWVDGERHRSLLRSAFICDCCVESLNSTSQLCVFTVLLLPFPVLSDLQSHLLITPHVELLNLQVCRWPTAQRSSHSPLFTSLFLLSQFSLSAPFPLPCLYICLASLSHFSLHSSLSCLPTSPPSTSIPLPPLLLIPVAVGSLFKCSIGEGLRFMQGQCGMW